MCEAEANMGSETICGKLKWYCHDPGAHDILDMRNSVCSSNQWSTAGCCYADNGASCNRDTLLEEASNIAG